MKAREGKIKGFTGIDSPFEAPQGGEKARFVVVDDPTYRLGRRMIGPESRCRVCPYSRRAGSVVIQRPGD